MKYRNVLIICKNEDIDNLQRYLLDLGYYYMINNKKVKIVQKFDYGFTDINNTEYGKSCFLIRTSFKQAQSRSANSCFLCYLVL